MTYAIPRFASVQVDGDLIRPDRDGYVRMLPTCWKKLRPELQNLDFDAQEYVCQLCAAYLVEHSPKIANAYKSRRKFLLRTGKSLRRLTKWLDRKPDTEELADALRLAHRPFGDSLTSTEIAGLFDPELYFKRNGIPDPGNHVITFTECIQRAAVFFEEERVFFQSEPTRTHALWKTKPRFRKGRMEYLLLRIFRERSNPKATVRVAHLMISFFRKLDRRTLKFDQEKKYCPAINTAINLLTPEAKAECDHRLLRDLNMGRPGSER